MKIACDFLLCVSLCYFFPGRLLIVAMYKFQRFVNKRFTILCVSFFIISNTKRSKSRRGYQPQNRIPMPKIKITDPAIMCMYFSLFLKSVSEVPLYPINTVTSMVEMVAIPKSVATANTPNILC